MSPGINDDQRSKGAFPKSNKSSRNRRSSSDSEDNNNLGGNNTLFSEYAQRNKPILQTLRPLLSESENNIDSCKSRCSKNKPPQAADSSSIFLDSPHKSRDEYTPLSQLPWKLSSSNKCTNMVKMMDCSQIEQRIKEIRENIGQTKYMIDLFSGSNDPNVQDQREMLIKMVDDLSNTECTLKRFLRESYDQAAIQNGESSENTREVELNKKVAESQRKLAILLQQQTELAKMTSTKAPSDNEGCEEDDYEEEGTDRVLVDELQANNNGKIEKLDSDTGIIMNKLEELEHKKERIDHLLQELQAVQLLEFNADGSRLSSVTDKVAELDARRAQLARLKNLLKGTMMNDSNDESVTSEQSQDQEIHTENELMKNSTFDEDRNDVNNTETKKAPTLEEIQAITKEMKAHQQLLLEARSSLSTMKSVQQEMQQQVELEKKLQNSEKKFNGCSEKDYSLSTSQFNGTNQEFNQNPLVQSNDRNTPYNCTHPYANDTLMTSTASNENASNIVAQPQILDPNICMMPPANFMMPLPIPNQLPQVPFWQANNQALNAMSSAEYYKQLLINSQAQHLQTMNTTMHQCYHLIWSQQREMLTMKNTIAQLQAHVRNLEARLNPEHFQEASHSNLNRSQQHFSTLEAALPPSASLPNLVTLPGIPLLSPQAPVQPPQLNNQVPPGNRANNYWDNFRSYSRQNLLSGGSNKPTSDYATSISSSHGPVPTNAAPLVGTNIVSQVNKYKHLDNQSESNYSLNLHDNQSMPRDSAEVSHFYDFESGDVISGVCSKLKKKIKKVTVDDLRQILKQYVEQQESEQSIQTNKATISSSNLSNGSKYSDESELGAYGGEVDASNCPLESLDCVESNASMHSLNLPVLNNAESSSTLLEVGISNVSSTTGNFILVESTPSQNSRETPEEIFALNSEENISDIEQ